jgi:hypothetical protein
MATANIAAPKFTIAQKLAHAHEMATEISEESSRQYCLATAILTGHIEADTVEKGLAEVLEPKPVMRQRPDVSPHCSSGRNAKGGGSVSANIDTHGRYCQGVHYRTG